MRPVILFFCISAPYGSGTSKAVIIHDDDVIATWRISKATWSPRATARFFLGGILKDVFDILNG
jgi:hypothetical protein